MRRCPSCSQEQVNDLGRCTNTKCTVYCMRVMDDIPVEVECPECMGDGFTMVCYGNAPIELRCELCYGEGYIDDEE